MTPPWFCFICFVVWVQIVSDSKGTIMLLHAAHNYDKHVSTRGRVASIKPLTSSVIAASISPFSFFLSMFVYCVLHSMPFRF